MDFANEDGSVLEKKMSTNGIKFFGDEFHVSFRESETKTLVSLAQHDVFAMLDKRKLIFPMGLVVKYPEL